MFRQLWTPQAIQDHILTREGREPLNSHYYATTYPAVYAAAERIFGSWGDAITACGIDYATIRKYRVWSHEKVLLAIRSLSGNNEPLHSQYAQRHHKALYLAALKRFGAWGKAIQAAGGRYDDIRLRRGWSVEQVRDAIVSLHEKGVDLAYPYMRTHYQYLLAAGMKKLGGGSWAAARRACGIADNFRIRPEKRRLLARQGDLFDAVSVQ